MVNDYAEPFDCVLAVAQSMLGHAGDVEVFEDKDGWLCIRTKLMKTNDIVHEPLDGHETPKETRAALNRERSKSR